MTATERHRRNVKLADDLEAMRIENPLKYRDTMDLLDAMLASQGLEPAEKESAVLSWIAVSQPWSLADIAAMYPEPA